MSLSPVERKVALLREGVTVSALAKRLNITVSHVSQVVLGKRRSPRVEAAVAEAIRRAPEDVFPSADSRELAS